MKQYETWITKAENDLKSAKKLIEGTDPIYDTSIYHAQQCAEKALKAYLSYKDQPIQKTHDVQFLVELCIELDGIFESIMEDAILLNPYSTLFRYPDIILEPEKEDVIDAIEKAENILHFVKKLIRDEEVKR